MSALAIGAVLLAASVACTPRDAGHQQLPGRISPGHACSGRSSSSSGIRTSNIVLPNDTALDARGVQFDDTTLGSDGHRVGVKIYPVTGTRDDLCFVGGSISSSIDAVTRRRGTRGTRCRA